MKLLVVEDEPRMGELLHRGLTEEGHLLDRVSTAREAREMMLLADYDVVVLDWGLPDSDGLSLLRAWRAEGRMTPVLMLTARGSSGEKVLGLRTGADDFLTKPFAFEELVARLEALHRRAASVATATTDLGDVSFQRARRHIVCRVQSCERAAELTGREFQLLNELAERPGDLRTRAELLQRVWGANFDGDPNVVDVYVGYLRAKFEEIKTLRVSIATVRGSGYRLVIKPNRPL
jgi:two-component system, OmpR family, response regulator